MGYQQLLNQLYAAVYQQHQRFASDLYATEGRKLIHSVGKSGPGGKHPDREGILRQAGKLRDQYIKMLRTYH